MGLCLLPPGSCPMSWPSGCPSTSLHVLKCIHPRSPSKLNCIMEKNLMKREGGKALNYISSVTQTLRRSWSIMMSQLSFFNITLTAAHSGHWNTLVCTCVPFSIPGQRLQDRQHIKQSITYSTTLLYLGRARGTAQEDVFSPAKLKSHVQVGVLLPPGSHESKCIEAGDSTNIIEQLTKDSKPLQGSFSKSLLEKGCNRSHMSNTKISLTTFTFYLLHLAFISELQSQPWHKTHIFISDTITVAVWKLSSH